MTFTVRIAALGLLSFAWMVSSSIAQSDRRYVLGETVSFERDGRASPERRDFVGRGRGTNPPLGRRPTRPGAPRADSTSNGLFPPIALGLVGGTVGLLAGGFAGAGLAEASDCDALGCLAYPLLGGVIGEAVGLSSGVHLGTERGNYLTTLLGGALGTAVGLGVVRATDEPRALALVPVVQLGVAIPIARATR